MIIVYPEDGWNSFVDVIVAGEKLEAIGGGDKWNALTDPEKEQMLIKSAMLLTVSATPSTECNFPDAQVLLIQFDLENGGKYLSFEDSSGGEYTRAKVGTLEVEYNLKDEGIGMASGGGGLPPMVTTILNDCLRNVGNVTRGFHVV